MNASDIVADRLIERGIYLERYKSGFNRKILALLEDLENDLTKELAAAFAKKIPNAATRIRRLEALLADTRGIIKRVYAETSSLAGKELLQLSKNEQTYVVGAINEGIGIDLAGTGILINPAIAAVTAKQAANGAFERVLNFDELKKLVDGTLIQGAKSADWWSRQEADLTQRFTDQVRMGVLRGETLDQLVARVRGTQAKLYTDGVMQTTRRAAEALVRTSVQSVANATRNATFGANADLISAISWQATLDSRTTKICLALSGKCWDAEMYKPIGHDKQYPGPTAHWNCRSVTVPVVKSWRDLQDSIGADKLDAEFKRQLEKQGFTPDEIAKIKRNTRASMDGQVSADITFDAWLSKKTPQFQDQLLGKGRGKLFRDGKITLTDLINQNGRPLTIDELEALSQPRPKVKAPRL